MPVFKDQLLTKISVSKAETNSKKALYSLVSHSHVGAVFEQYELKITNKETLTRILVALKDVLTFSSPAILEHRLDIELIVFHCLLHDDHIVFDQAAKIIHTIFLSLLSIYPTNVGSLNPSDLTEQGFANLFKEVGRLPKKNIEIEWHLPSDKEKQYAQELYTTFFDKNLNHIEQEHLQGVSTQKPELGLLANLVDDMHLKKVEVSNVQREGLGRRLSLVNYAFLGISQRASFARRSKPIT